MAARLTGGAARSERRLGALRYPRSIARPLVLRRPVALPALPAAVYPAGLLLALVLPFEAIQPVQVTPWLSLTNLKLVILLAGAAWLLPGSLALPSGSEWRALAPSLALLGVALLAARLAPDFGDEALRFVWRLAAAAFVLLLVVRLAQDRARLRGLLWAIVVSSGISALLGIGEAAGWPPVSALLSLFKVAPTRVGGELRVGASFQYATIAAMYFEMATPVAIALAATAKRRTPRVLALAIAAVCTANVVLSLTRAGMLTLGVMFVLLLVAACGKRSLRPVLVPTALSAAILLGGVAMLAARNTVFDMRLFTENDADWYGAAYTAPASMRLEADQSVSIDLEVRNEGRLGWWTTDKHSFALGYRWLTADGNGVLDLPPGEVALTGDVAPGEIIHLQPRVHVPALPPGSYRLGWGMLQRDVLQFYERGWADAETLVEIESSPNTAGIGQVPNRMAVFEMPAILPRDDGEAPWVVGRLDLWGAALRLIQTRPLLGVGPDNFRHLYGAQLGLETWDERIQANNLYLELLVDVGVLGLAAFIWLIAAPLSVATQVLNLSPARSARSITNPTEVLPLTGSSPIEGLSGLRSPPGCSAIGQATGHRSLSGPDTRKGAAERRATGDRDTTGVRLQPGTDIRRGAAERRPTGADIEAPTSPQRLVVLGIGLAVVAFLLHGLLDAFLAFTPTALLLWMLLGMLLAQKPQVSGR